MTLTSTRFITETTVAGVKCSHSQCPNAIRGPEMNYYGGGRDYYLRLACDQGWTRWLSRTDHLLCPDHQPRPDTKMRQIKP